jgi:hypothetical protein
MGIGLFSRNKDRKSATAESSSVTSSEVTEPKRTEKSSTGASKQLLTEDIEKLSNAAEFAEFLGKNKSITNILLYDIDSSRTEIRTIAPLLNGGISRFEAESKDKEEVHKIILNSGFKQVGTQGRGISLYQKT